ncbi:aa3-type cytochrome c oxidase subunit IV [Curvivirga aplysinae]|nr:aa3-type cytochrome c oxidase subunit IV [Curvivirga aplysinae]MTI10538.1 aa3-type cytochrome c oxidase subunit IV [Curvivirga aplysinae]
MDQMEHLEASRDHVETWNNLTKLFVWGSVGIALVLAVMGLTLV